LRALHAALVSFALGLVPASDCLGTVLYPEYVIEADPPVWGPGSVKPDHIPLTVLIRDDIAVEGVRLSDAARAEGLQLIPEEAPWDRDVPEGYRLERYRIMGRLAPETQDIEVELTVEGEAVRKQIVLTEAALSDPPTPVLVEVPRIDPSSFSSPLPSPRVGIAPASKPGPMTAPRLVAVTGRILFQLPDGTPVGVDGATVKVMEPVDILDDNPLGEGVTDVNGDIDFTFIMDGTQDIYVRVEAANGTAVNVGTGLFFHTYARHIDYDAFSGTVIDLGNISWGGNFNTALWLTYAITWAQRSIEGGGYDLDRMHIRYPDDSQEVSWYSPLGGTEGIHLRSDRAWRTSTLYHEYGHHFVYQHAAAIAPAYCNGLCEPAGSCGHCYWCEENEAVAWSEGFPTWIAYLLRRTHAADLGWELPDFSPRDDEYIQGCGEKGGSLERAMSTEGQFTSFLIDLVDGNNENDPAYDTEAMDRTQFDPELILHVATVDRPTNSYTFIADMRDYLQTLPGFTNLDLVHYWSTVRNNGLDEDGIPPTAPTSVSSTTHPVGVSSASNMPVLLFSGGVDDFSGVQAHYVTMTQNNPAAPDESGTTFDGSSLTWPLPLAPGTWYANVRAVDGAGNRSLDHISYGPMLIAPPLPIDLEPTVDYLWENPIVVRNTPDATGTAAGYPAELLPGDAYLNLFFANTSPSGAPGDTLTVVMHLDGNVQEWFPVFRPTIGAGEQFVFTNMGPHNLAGGGRHRVTAKIDITNALPETDELNNNHGVSFVVRPEPLIPGPWQTMPPPPNAEQGSEVIPGTPDNVAGVRLTPAHEFGAVLMHPNDANWYSAYELRAFQPSSGVTNGFDTALATATAGSGIAAIVVAAAGSPTGSFDFGVRANPAIYDYRIRAVDSIPRPLVGVTSLGWTEDDWLSLLEFDFGPGDLGYFNITLSVDYESFGLNQSIDLYWIAQADTAKALAYAVLGQVGRDRFFTTDLNIVGEGTYALAVRRHNAYNLWATAAAIDVATHTSPLPEVSIPLVYPKWPGGFVPTPSFTQDDTLDFPTELLGEVASTYINFAVQNLGSAPTPFFTAKMYVGTEKALTASLGPILPGAWLEYRHPTPFTIGGGRRVLSLVLDPDDLMTELSEQNNVYAMQWGWTGYTIYPGQPLSRPYPPDPAAWLGSVPVLLASNPAPDGEDGDAVPLNFIAPNCDGLRLDPSQAGSGIDWHGVALMPAAGENVDLELFQGGVPAALAYVDDLAGSHSDSSACEFVLVDLGEGAQGVFDAGVYAVTGNQNYVVHAAAAAPLPTPWAAPPTGPSVCLRGRS